MRVIIITSINPTWLIKMNRTKRTAFNTHKRPAVHRRDGHLACRHFWLRVIVLQEYVWAHCQDAYPSYFCKFSSNYSFHISRNSSSHFFNNTLHTVHTSFLWSCSSINSLALLLTHANSYSKLSSCHFPHSSVTQAHCSMLVSWKLLHLRLISNFTYTIEFHHNPQNILFLHVNKNIFNKLSIWSEN